jgi:hypothetical protein
MDLMFELTDLEARPSHTAQAEDFLALDTGAQSCFGLIEGRCDGLSFIGKGGPEVGRLGCVGRVRLWPPHLNCHGGNITGRVGRCICTSELRPVNPRIEIGPPQWGASNGRSCEILRTPGDGSSLSQMLGHDHPAGIADKAQAEYFCGFLEQEKSELQARLAAQTRRLTMCMTEGEMTPISHVRRAIRTTEGDLGAIDRMLKALRRRFPAEEDVRRRA